MPSVLEVACVAAAAHAVAWDEGGGKQWWHWYWCQRGTGTGASQVCPLKSGPASSNRGGMRMSSISILQEHNPGRQA